MIFPKAVVQGHHVTMYWHKRPGQRCPEDEVCLDRASSPESFLSLVNRKCERDLQLTRFDASWTLDQPLFLGVWEPRDRPHVFRLDLTRPGFEREHKALRTQGYRLLHLKHYRSFQTEKIAAIWEAGPATSLNDELPCSSPTPKLADRPSTPSPPLDQHAFQLDFDRFLKRCGELRQEGFYLAQIEITAPVIRTPTQTLTTSHLPPAPRSHPSFVASPTNPTSPGPSPTACDWVSLDSWLGIPRADLTPAPPIGNPLPKHLALSGIWYPGSIPTRLLTGLSCEPCLNSCQPGEAPVRPSTGQTFARCSLLQNLSHWNQQGFRVADLEAYKENGFVRYAVLLHRLDEGFTQPEDDWLLVSAHLSEARISDRQLRQGIRPGGSGEEAGFFPVDFDLLYSEQHSVDDRSIHNGLVHNAGTSGPPDG